MKKAGLGEAGIIRGIGRGDAWKDAPRIGVQTKALLECVGFWPVDDVEGQREFLLHLLSPLVSQRRRADDQDASDAPPNQEFRKDEARFDGLAEADVVSKQQRHSWHLQRLQERHQLEVINLDRAVKR